MNKVSLLRILVLVLISFCILGAYAGEKVSISIQVDKEISADDVDISIPVYKYNKDFAVSFTGDDALMGIYQRAFNYSLGRYVDDKDIFHEGAETPTTGTASERILSYTDGCGNSLPFRFGINWIASQDGKNIHKDGNKWTAYMWWSELERFLDFGNSVMNHGGGYDKTDPEASINKTYFGVRDTVGIAPYILGIPGGTTGFPEAAATNENVLFVESSSFSINYKKYIIPQILEASTLMKGHFPRRCVDGLTFDEVKSILENGIKDKYWTNLFCHNIKNGTGKVNGQFNANECYAMLDYIYMIIMVQQEVIKLGLPVLLRYLNINMLA